MHFPSKCGGHRQCHRRRFPAERIRLRKPIPPPQAGGSCIFNLDVGGNSRFGKPIPPPQAGGSCIFRPNVAVIGSAITAGFLLSVFG